MTQVGDIFIIHALRTSLEVLHYIAQKSQHVCRAQCLNFFLAEPSRTHGKSIYTDAIAYLFVCAVLDYNLRPLDILSIER